MPSRAVHHDSRTQQPIEHELWYSVVCRYMTFGPGGRDPSRRVLGWQRMCVWSNFELADSSTTFVIFRCKEEIKQKFLNHFTGDGGARLWDHPMLAHAFMLQHKTMQTTAFQHEFADPLYLLEEEGEAVRSVHEHTRRAKNFLALSRRLEQITTDFDILESSINLVKREVKTYERDFCDQPGVAITSKGTSGNGIALLACPPRNVSTLLDDTLGSLIDDIGLARSYNRVYRERARIGINECFAVVNQLDAEQNNHTARESAAIALASRSDNLSLRTIQYMSMLFLPASLASSIFGMGFFTTDVDDNGNSHFFVSTKWWMWVLISVVLTLVCFAIVFWGASWNAERKRISDEDTKEV
ncbi:hypothetical protein DM02DRAFT_112284 [Periconia macrospinosa]|uniref:Cora-domain-containing protein n=1 Tax=Periconia macrospinosa TaxID=97972 RepID=A0A2V1E3X0_9PLEO|nr:hypothetical protein DM02DRAFT_112284 [Periconia macrospinosa]